MYTMHIGVCVIIVLLIFSPSSFAQTPLLSIPSVSESEVIVYYPQRLFQQPDQIGMVHRNSASCTLPTGFDPKKAKILNFTPKIENDTEDLTATLLSCAGPIVEGMWQSTGGVALDIGNCIWDLHACANSKINELKNLYGFAKNFADEIYKFYHTISSLTPEQGREMICSLMGSVGVSAIFAAVTGGATVGNLASRIALIAAKIPKLAVFLNKMRGLPLSIRKLAVLSEEQLARVEKYISFGFKKEVVSACGL